MPTTTNTKFLSVTQAAAILGISDSTLRHWHRNGRLQAHSAYPIRFTTADIAQLHTQLSDGSVSTLTTRANKKHANTRHIPYAYGSQPKVVAIVKHILEKYTTASLDLQRVMLLAALRLFEITGDILRPAETPCFNIPSNTLWQRNAVQQEIRAWVNELTVAPEIDDTVYQHLFDGLTVLPQGDFLGLLYQSLCQSGNKSVQGAFYTPEALVIDAINAVSAHETCDAPDLQGDFLDPCCGTGAYLLQAAKQLGLPLSHVFGTDIDSIAVRLARINLLLAYPQQDVVPEIAVKDFLQDYPPATAQQFDLIISNPPWGAHKNTTTPAHFSSEIQSSETFALFICQAIRRLKTGGRLSFVLPESILNIHTHAATRLQLLRQGRIINIAKLGKPFQGVYSRAVRIDWIKTALAQTANDVYHIDIIDPDSPSHQINAQRFWHNDSYCFDIDMREIDADIINKIYRTPHTTLQHQADWALGIVTGDNQKHLTEVASPTVEMVLRGVDIQPFGVTHSGIYLHFAPERLQQVASEAYYRAPEKLIYRFISQRLVVAYDAAQCLTLNSANIIIPYIDPALHISIKVVLALLNSTLLQYVFAKKFATLKVLKRHLEILPLPILSSTQCQQIEALVDTLIQHPASVEPLKELNDIVFNLFGLSSAEIAVVCAVVGD